MRVYDILECWCEQRECALRSLFRPRGLLAATQVSRPRATAAGELPFWAAGKNENLLTVVDEDQLHFSLELAHAKYSRFLLSESNLGPNLTAFHSISSFRFVFAEKTLLQ